MSVPPPGPSAPDESYDPFEGEEWDDGIAPRNEVAPGAAPPARRPRHTSRRRLRRRRRLGLAMVVVGGVVVALGIYLLVTALLARSELNSVRAEGAALRKQIVQGDFAGARANARRIAGHAGRADSLTGGPVWALAAGVPGQGNPFRTVRVMTDQVDALGTGVLPRLVSASANLDPATLRAPDGAIRLARISAAVPTLDQALRAMTRTTGAVAAQPAHTWLSVVDNARASLLRELHSLDGTLHSADLTARIAPQLLGEHGVKRYFVAFQNEAEARGTGGLPGAFAILRADQGKISFERFESDDTLSRTPVSLDFGAGYHQLFDGAQTMTLYGNANLSPHFPYAAQIWLAMWAKHSGQKLDGVIAVDPTLLSYLLRVTGPATLPDHTVVSYRNLVGLTQSGVYAKFPKPSQTLQRKEYLLDIARAVSRVIVDGKINDLKLVRAAGTGVGERRLLIYSTDRALESQLDQTTVAGAIPQTKAPYVGLSIVNDGGNKLDYYLRRSLTWQRTGCGQTRNVTVTVRLTNNAPASGLPPEVIARSDQRNFAIKPGDNRLDVSYYATRGAQLVSVDVNGTPATSGVADDLGHTVLTVEQELPRGTTQTIVWHLREPAGVGKPIVLHQPLIYPLSLALRNATC